MLELSLRELYTIRHALALEHDFHLDRRRKMRPSERAVGMAEARRLLEKVRDRIEELEKERGG